MESLPIVRSATRSDPEIRQRRDAVVQLAEALRELVEAAVRTTAAPEVLRSVAARARQAAEPLAAAARGRFDRAAVDDPQQLTRYYNAVSGPGNPLAPPLHTSADGESVTGSCTLGLAYEGPYGWAHGGVSAALLDHVLGHATFAATGRAGLTVSLTLRYRGPVPLQTPLWLSGRAVTDDGGKITVAGAIATAADPQTPLVEADGAFVHPRPDQQRRMSGPAAG